MVKLTAVEIDRILQALIYFTEKCDRFVFIFSAYQDMLESSTIPELVEFCGQMIAIHKRYADELNSVQGSVVQQQMYEDEMTALCKANLATLYKIRSMLN